MDDKKKRKTKSASSAKSHVSEEEEVEKLEESERLKIKMREILAEEELQDFQSEHFTHLETVGKTLDDHHGFKNVNLVDEVKKLKKRRKDLNKTVKSIVNVNFDKFNQTLQSFTDILRNFEFSRGKVTSLNEKMKRCESLLKLRTKYLKNLYDDYKINREYVKLLKEISVMKNVPALLKEAMEKKHFLYAVNLINEQSKIMKEPKYRQIKELETIRYSIKKRLESLPEHLFTGLIDLCYHAPTIDPSPLENGEKEAIEKTKHLIKFSKRRRKSKAVMGGDFFGQARKRLIVRDDLKTPIRPHSEKYVRILVETLYKLSQLNQAKTRLHQSLHLNLTSLVNDHIRSFLLEIDLSEEGYDFAQGRKLLDELTRVKLQKPCLLSFFKELFRELIRVLKNFRYVLSLLDEKIRLGKELEDVHAKLAREGVVKRVKVSGESALNQKLTKEVLVRLRESLRFKLDRMKDRKIDKAYKISIQDLLRNFIEKEIMGQSNEVESGQMQVLTLHEMFVDKLKSLIQKRDSIEISGYIKKFKSLLIESLSKVDEFSSLTMHDVWEMVQIVLKEKLLSPILQFGKGSNPLSSSPKSKKKKTKSGGVANLLLNADDEWAELLKKETILFRYDLNIEKDMKESKESKLSVFNNSFQKYFACTPYNMIWLYSPILDFVKSAELAVGPTEYDEYQLVHYIHKQMDSFLITKTRDDYLGYTSEILALEHGERILFRPIVQCSFEEFEDPKTLKFQKYVRELIDFYEAIPKFQKEYCSIMENIMMNFFSKLQEQVSDISRNLLVRKYLISRKQEGHSKLYDVMITDPAFKRVYDTLLSEEDEDDSKEQLIFEESLRETLHERLGEVKVIHYTAMLQKTSQIMLISHIHNISEYLYNFFSSEFVLKDLSKVEKYRTLANECLFSIKLDIHTHCYFHLKNMSSMIYERERKPVEPEGFVQELNNDLNRIERSIRPYLHPSKIQYIFEGVGNLVCQFFLNSLPKIEHRKFNSRGVMLIQRNIVAVQQNLSQFTTLHRRGEEMFQKVRTYYELLNMTPEKFFNHVKNVIEENRPQIENRNESVIFSFLETEEGDIEITGLDSNTEIHLPYTEDQYIAVLDTEDLNDYEFGPKARSIIKSIFKNTNRIKKRKLRALEKKKKVFEDDTDLDIPIEKNIVEEEEVEGELLGYDGKTQGDLPPSMSVQGGIPLPSMAKKRRKRDLPKTRQRGGGDAKRD